MKLMSLQIQLLFNLFMMRFFFFLFFFFFFFFFFSLIENLTLKLEKTNRKLMTERYKNDEDVAVQLAACRIQLNSGDYQKDTVFITYHLLLSFIFFWKNFTSKITNSLLFFHFSEESIANILPEYIKDTHTIEEWRHLVSVFHEKLKGLPKDRMIQFHSFYFFLQFF